MVFPLLTALTTNELNGESHSHFPLPTLQELCCQGDQLVGCWGQRFVFLQLLRQAESTKDQYLSQQREQEKSCSADLANQGELLTGIDGWRRISGAEILFTHMLGKHASTAIHLWNPADKPSSEVGSELGIRVSRRWKTAVRDSPVWYCPLLSYLGLLPKICASKLLFLESQRRWCGPNTHYYFAQRD